VEEVLPALQQARGSQGNEVMAVPVGTSAQMSPRPSLARRLMTFYLDVVAEMKKVTWPDVGQVRQLSIAVIVLALFIGLLIAVLDLVLQQILVEWIPSMFGS
jgi:preprotein translocase subunit SecE